MFESLKNCTYLKGPVLALTKRNFIGIDVGYDAVKMVQLDDDGGSISLIAGGVENCPSQMTPGSGDWQRWAAETISDLIVNDRFKGRDVVAAIPANEILIELMKIPKTNNRKAEDTIFSKVREKLPFDSVDVIMRYISTEEDNCLVMVTEREKIDRHLAIYEKANLQIKTINSWPVSLINTYTTFFGRRKSDIDTVVMLLDIGIDYTNVVICRHKNLLFARLIPIGADSLNDDEISNRLISELTDCKQQFSSMYRKAKIQRLIFLSPGIVNRNVYETIAQRLSMPAQMGDCLAAVEMPTDWDGSGIDRRDSRINWATAFGLSLS
ncbi:MAG: pilus assembly protein PilM [Planctomycetes bacterium]|nr:pilus assembly protein PilM [Planctomycetota bacterium]